MAVQCTVQRAPAAGTVTVPELQAPPSGRETTALTHLRADLKKKARANRQAEIAALNLAPPHFGPQEWVEAWVGALCGSETPTSH